MTLCRLLVPGLMVVLLAGESWSAPNAGWDEVDNLRRAITDLQGTHGRHYQGGEKFLERLEALARGTDRTKPHWRKEFDKLKREALTANPDLSGRLLLVKRRTRNPIKDVAIPAPHASNSGLKRTGYDNEIVLADLDRPDKKWTTVFRPGDGGYAGELDLHWDAKRLLFTRSDATNWKLWEMAVDPSADSTGSPQAGSGQVGSGLRQVSQTAEDIDCFDGCYLPDDHIVFGSTATFQSVPCHHGAMPTQMLYRMAPDGSAMRQLCFDQDMNVHPVVLANGQVLYSRWDYTGISHIYLRQLMAMNPDGTRQRMIYGTNSWFPNSLFFSRPLPGDSNRLVSILSGYHGVPRMGWLVIVNPAAGWREADGIETRISGRGDPVAPLIKDNTVDKDRPLFLHPYPVTDKHFLVSGLERGPKQRWKIYLADVFDNLVPLFTDPEYSLLEPVMVRPRERPPVLADRVDTSRHDATVFIQDIYAGPGLQGVPRGAVKRLRVLAYHFGYRGLAGSDKIGYGGPWDAMRILGTTPVEADGSAHFKIPANTPVAVQPLDEENMAVQLMRSWMVGMPGERVSCVGCHESPAEASPSVPALASQRSVLDLEPWFGPARGFDFAREVQPVLNRRCAGCHDGEEAEPDLRPEDQVEQRATFAIGYPHRLDPQMAKDTGGRMTYTPAYDALVHYIRRPGIEDDVSLLVPGEYHADTSPLIQLLRHGHHGVELDEEEWDRLVTWIDLNGPCHGTWGDVYPIPNRAHQRRLECWKLYGGPNDDPEEIPAAAAKHQAFVKPADRTATPAPEIPDWPWSSREAAATVQSALDLGGGTRMDLVRVPGGNFLTGAGRKATTGPFWIGACEVTNAQFLQFDPAHSSGYYMRRISRPDGQGLPLDGPEQPVVRVSWQRAMDYCEWLSEKTGLKFTLPDDEQWEWACRAGSAEAFSFGSLDNDYSRRENLADRTFSRGVLKPQKVHPDTVTQWSGGVPHLVLEGGKLADTRFDDRFSVTAPVGSFEPNAWGLHDMHGNAAEWVRSAGLTAGRRGVRGGSFFDPPRRSTSASRIDYAEWRRVFNVGFRVVCTSPDDKVHP